MAQDVRRVPKQDRARKSVDAILQATAELLAEGESGDVTMSAIGQRAGISKAAIYRYFPDRSAVVYELAIRYLAELEAHLDTTIRSIDSLESAIVAIDAVIDQFFELMRDRPAMRQIWITGRNAPDVQRLMATTAHELAEKLYQAMSEHLAGTQEVNVRRIELLVHMSRAAVEMALWSEDDRAVLQDFKRSVLLTSKLSDHGVRDEIAETFGFPPSADDPSADASA